MIKALSELSESSFFASVNKWDYPMSQTARIMADQFDLLHKANTTGKKKLKPYPRPYTDKKKIKGTPVPLAEAVKTYADIRQRLAQFGGSDG